MAAFLLTISSLLLSSARVKGELDYLTVDEEPDPGPSLDTVYVPGTPGAAWTVEEIQTTRERILQGINPDWEVQYNMTGIGAFLTPETETVTENKIMRLVFHDCVRYTDGTGGCDGCLRWKGVGDPVPDIFDKSDNYKFDPVKNTDNNGLEYIVKLLEKIYTTVDWPFRKASLTGSLQQLGKSRADLWQFAGLVALEKALERANRACDLDKWSRQQITLLEGREACEFKLRAPLKFWYGRADCVTTKTKQYKASKKEVQPRLLGDGNHATDFFLEEFGMSAEHSQALQAVHGAVHAAMIGVKYTWFGSGYISNMYYKWIANYATYQSAKYGGGGDLSFKGDNTAGWSILNLHARGDAEGRPRNQTGWRASCMYSWDTIEGGPCVLRPVQGRQADGPDPEHDIKPCVTGYELDENNIIQPIKSKYCSDAWFDEDTIIHGSPYRAPFDEVVGPFNSSDPSEEQLRHNSGWNNQFAFPWEVGAYWNLTTSEENGQRAIGCAGLDTPFEDWPYKTRNSPIFGSPAMQCSKNTYQNLAGIIESFANDQQYWSVKFLEAWDIMATNGYDSLSEGPEEGWLGYYSLYKQGKLEGESLASLIEQNKDTGLVWTDPTVDPNICGHKGHFKTSCGLTFSHVYDSVLNGDGQYEGKWKFP